MGIFLSCLWISVRPVWLEQPLVFTLSTLEVIEDFKTEKCQHMTYASKGSLDVLC